MLKIEHIAIAVNDLSVSKSLFSKLLAKESHFDEEIISEKVKSSFFQIGGNKIELLEATDENSPIAKFLKKKGEGIHHIAFEVADIRAEMQRLKSEGFELLSEEPKLGANNMLICFVHPKTANGVLIELCQKNNI